MTDFLDYRGVPIEKGNTVVTPFGRRMGKFVTLSFDTRTVARIGKNGVHLGSKNDPTKAQSNTTPGAKLLVIAQ